VDLAHRVPDGFAEVRILGRGLVFEVDDDVAHSVFSFTRRTLKVA
jgi:hypothetical protein